MNDAKSLLEYGRIAVTHKTVITIVEPKTKYRTIRIEKLAQLIGQGQLEATIWFLGFALYFYKEGPRLPMLKATSKTLKDIKRKSREIARLTNNPELLAAIDKSEKALEFPMFLASVESNPALSGYHLYAYVLRKMATPIGMISDTAIANSLAATASELGITASKADAKYIHRNYSEEQPAWIMEPSNDPPRNDKISSKNAGAKSKKT